MFYLIFLKDETYKLFRREYAYIDNWTVTKVSKVSTLANNDSSKMLITFIMRQKPLEEHVQFGDFAKYLEFAQMFVKVGRRYEEV